MAQSASLVLLRLVVERGNRLSTAVRGQRVALHAQSVNWPDPKQTRVRRTVWCVATPAPFGLHRKVFEEEGAFFVAVALEADLLLVGGCSQRAAERLISAMDIVAIVAGNQLLVYAMPERFGEISFRVDVAGIAEIRLVLNKQRILLASVMSRVAANTTDTVLLVLRAHEVAVLLRSLMASQTAFADFGGASFFEDEDLALIASGLDVSSTGAMAGFAAMDLRAIHLEG